MRISLTAEDFEILVKGGIVQKGNTKIILQDIGWRLMMQLIQKAENELTK